jgi:hypothetical protein
MSKIPRHIIERHKEGVERLTFYGHPVVELDRDELLAMVNCLAEESKAARERVLAGLEMFRAIRSAMSGGTR